MIATIWQDGHVVSATLKSGDLRPGTFTGVWSAYEVTSDDLPGVEFETKIGVRGRADVTIEVVL